jgi:uncharacterized protein (TIGR03382 family)
VKKTNLAILAAVVGSAASVASADPTTVLTWLYNDLNGSFSFTGVDSGVLTANASAVSGGLNTAGVVNRQIPVNGAASFGPGFLGTSPPANFTSTINVSAINGFGPGTALGNGNFTLTGVNGATISGDISGVFVSTNLGINFNGQLDNIVITGAMLQGDVGAIDLTFPGLLQGSNTLLLFQTPGFFDQSFTGVPTQFQAEIVPTPGALALAGVGLLAAGRRRR